MNAPMRILAPVLLSFVFVMPGASFLNAQITQAIRANIDHSFVIGNTTLPPGEYTFRIEENTDLHVMTVASENNKTDVSFLVRESLAEHTPAHSTITFRKYGNTEFLDKVFEGGSKDGVRVIETGREESHMVKMGQQSTEHIEEQR